jgi:hypothetical protein
METNRIFLVAAFCVLLCSMNIHAANPGADTATCTINVTVASIIEWEGGNFAAINLTTIDAQADAPEGTAAYTLWTNCNVVLTADTDADSQLKDQDGGASDTLVTKYKLSVDGDGSASTGSTVAAIGNSSSAAWVLYSSFLATGLQVTHVYNDGNVEVTLSVQATNNADEVADAGDYQAVQTITASWVSDHS